MAVLATVGYVAGAGVLWSTYQARAVLRRVLGALRHSAPLSTADRVVNAVLGMLLPLGGIGLPGVAEEENKRRLEKCRGTITGIDKSGYEAGIKDHWTAEAIDVPVSGERSVKVYVHTPKGDWAASIKMEETPMVVYTHGGGMTIGNAQEGFGAGFMKDLAPAKAFCWASVDYRRAPENMFPSGVDDLEAAFKYLVKEDVAAKFGYNSSKVGLCGVSAGAVLAALASARVAAAKTKPAFLMFGSGMLDPFMATDSWKTFYGLPACPGVWVAWGWRSWLTGNGYKEPSDEQKKSASALLVDWSPYRGTPALVINSSFDIMHDENNQLVKALQAESVDVSAVQATGCHCVYNEEAKKEILDWFSSHVRC